MTSAHIGCGGEWKLKWNETEKVKGLTTPTTVSLLTYTNDIRAH